MKLIMAVLLLFIAWGQDGMSTQTRAEVTVPTPAEVHRLIEVKGTKAALSELTDNEGGTGYSTGCLRGSDASVGVDSWIDAETPSVPQHA